MPTSRVDYHSGSNQNLLMRMADHADVRNHFHRLSNRYHGITESLIVVQNLFPVLEGANRCSDESARQLSGL